jgi:hypothetical protein
MPNYWREFFLILSKKLRMGKPDDKLLEMLNVNIFFYRFSHILNIFVFSGSENYRVGTYLKVSTLLAFLPLCTSICAHVSNNANIVVFY